MIDRKELLTFAAEKGATDIHICADAPILFRIGGHLAPATKERLSAQQSREMSLDLLTEDQRQTFHEKLDCDTMLVEAGGRYRINVGHFNGNVGAVVRILPVKPSKLDELHLPETVKALAHRTKGLVLLTGSTSQGKTTTMAAMIDEINASHKKHIITIEDPIEYVHTNKTGIVRQRQIGEDTPSFQTGLRAALRQDPDVIAIGEMRDYETIKIALTAAEAGILVLSTLHAISIDKIIERLMSYSPDDSSGTLRYILAESLQGAIHQELVPATDGGLRVACEILVGTDAVRNIIRKKDGFYLRDVITTGKKLGMRTMAESVRELRKEGAITSAVAEGIMTNYRT